MAEVWTLNLHSTHRLTNCSLCYVSPTITGDLTNVREQDEEKNVLNALNGHNSVILNHKYLSALLYDIPQEDTGKPNLVMCSNDKI